MNFTFTTDDTFKRADEIVDYLLGPRLWIPRLDYPDFFAWVDRTHAQLKSEEKRAIVALSGGNVCGAVIYQKHKTEPDTLEIKNITVRPDMRGRYVASFLVRNAEVEGALDFKANRVVLDAKKRNSAIRSFLFKGGYLPLQTMDLYALGAGEDIVYAKRLP